MTNPGPQQIRQSCLEEYRTRMAKLYEDKKFISMKLLRNNHDIAKEISLKSLQKHEKSSLITEELEQLLNQELTQILEQVMEINFNWGKNFVESEFTQIENRLKGKEVKLVSSIKHEFNLFAEYFHKKTEPLSCKRLEIYFESFILEKAFDYTSNAFEAERERNMEQITSMKSKLSQKENETKQLRKQIFKQSSEALKTVENLQQSLSYHKNRSQLLESTINQLKSDREHYESEHETKMQQLQKSFLNQFTQFKQQKTALAQQLSTAKRTITVLESEIQKERQMHRQTNDHYKMMITDFKIREEELKEEISEITMRASQEIEIYKRDTERSLNRSSVCQSEKEKQGAKLVEQLNEANKKYTELQKSYSNLSYEMHLKKTEQEIRNNDLQIALKLAEQKLCEYESRLPRYKKFQQQLQSYQKLRQQFTTHQKQLQKQTALLKQQNTFLQVHLKQLQSKYQTQKTQNQQTKHLHDKLQEKLEAMNKVKVNEWVQTEREGDGRCRDMLQEALKVVQVIEAEYENVKRENARLRYRLQEY